MNNNSNSKTNSNSNIKSNSNSNNNNNNNNKNNKLNQISTNIELPLYIQKTILNYLCDHINQCFRLIEGYFLNDYRTREKYTIGLVSKISLICKYWFNHISKMIYVSVDLHHDRAFLNYIREIYTEKIKKKLLKHQQQQQDQQSTTAITTTESEEITNSSDDENSDNSGDGNDESDDNDSLNQIGDLLANVHLINNVDNDGGFINDYSSSSGSSNNNQNNLFKLDNMLVLKVHFSKKSFYKYISDKVEHQISRQLLKTKIKEIPNLETLIIRNIESNSNELYEMVREFQDKSKYNLEILELVMDRFMDEAKFNYIMEHTIKIHSIMFRNFTQQSIIMKLFDNIIPYQIKEILIKETGLPYQKLIGFSVPSSVDRQLYNNDELLTQEQINEMTSNQDEFYKKCFSDPKRINYFANIELLEIPRFKKLQDLYFILRSLPNLKELFFTICFDSLLYYFADQDEIIRNNLTLCSCGSLVCNNDSIPFNAFDSDSKSFKKNQVLFYWSLICDWASTHPLEILHMGHGCLDSGVSAYTIHNFKKSFPQSFINNIGKLILNFKSLKTIKAISFATCHLFEHLINNQDAQNSTLRGYQFHEFRNFLHEESYLKDLNRILDLHKQSIDKLELNIHADDADGDPKQLIYEPLKESDPISNYLNDILNKSTINNNQFN